MRYRTIVADPPWRYDEGWPGASTSPRSAMHRNGVIVTPRKSLPYQAMDLTAISGLPVRELAMENAHLYLWTTNRYLRAAPGVAEKWGFRVAQTLVWVKTPRGIGPGGAYASNVEFILFCRRGTLATKTRVDSSWWQWKRPGNGLHSRKPDAFLDLVEQVSPGPYLELFARRQRLGWDTWGDEALGHVEISS